MSLIKDQTNFILHFKSRPSVEMFSEERSDIIEVIQQVYWIKVLKTDANLPKLNLYGVSSKELNQYVTTEKDAIRRFNRIPSAYFLLNNEA